MDADARVGGYHPERGGVGLTAPRRRGVQRPVLLVTLGVPFANDAVRVAVDAAVETGQALYVVNVVELPPLVMSVNMRYDQLDDPPDLAASLSSPAELARSCGVHVERLRVRSPRPIEALLELVYEHSPGLLVFGPDRDRVKRRLYRKAVKRVREETFCLLWLADD